MIVSDAGSEDRALKKRNPDVGLPNVFAYVDEPSEENFVQ
jgi:hypothetical protein